MRPFEFRAYDNEYGMIYFKLGDTAVHPNENEFIYLDEFLMNCASHPMQYTGFKDKKERKIFESDIVEDEFGGKGVVRFEEGSFFVDMGEGIELQELTGNWCEVIGDIYQNKDSLPED